MGVSWAGESCGHWLLLGLGIEMGDVSGGGIGLGVLMPSEGSQVLDS